MNPTMTLDDYRAAQADALARRAPRAAPSETRPVRRMVLLAIGCLAAGVLAGFWLAASPGPGDIPQLQLDYRLSSTK